MNATASNRTLLAHITRLAHVALVAFALVLVTTEMSAAAVDERSPTQTAGAVVSPTARDDCLAGRRRTGTSAFRVGIDPAPTCSVLLAGGGAAKAAPYYYGRGDPYTNPATKRRSQEWSDRYGLLP